MVSVALLSKVGTPLEIVDAVLTPPGPGEVRVRMAASGVCHSDLSVRNGNLPLGVPIVPGHEGSGVVAEIGPDVTAVAVGDHVVLSWVPQCGVCWFCTRGQPQHCTSSSGAPIHLSVDDRSVRPMLGLGTFATETVVPVTAVVRIPAEIPLTLAALIGCGVLTGVGAATNTADIRPGDTVAVVGCGGVGLNVIQGARLAGATTVIAVDLVPAKLELARTFGATHVVDATEVEPVGAVRALTEGRGADVAFEVIGAQATVDQVVSMTRDGGEAVFIGMGGLGVTFSVPVLGFVASGKTFRGCLYGSADVHADVPRLLDHYGRGELLLDELVSQRIGLADVNDALDLIAEGAVTRSVIEY